MSERMSEQTIQRCWICGSEPQHTTRHMFSALWMRLECMCCAGGFSLTVESMIHSWHSVQDALLLQEALRQLNISPKQFIDAGELMRELVLKVSE